ncbi:MAG: SCO family protein [Actinomycetota bacterium]|nr:SCO family protein [Actinomycetota bacterium]
MNPRLVLALALVGVAALGAVALAGWRVRGDSAPSGAAQRFEGSILPAGLKAPSFSLRDQDGRRVRMSDFRGRATVITFLYTTCEQTCPAQAQVIKGAFADLGHDVPAVAVAVDPPGDTPANARRFLTEQRMNKRLRFALGSRGDLKPVWRGFAVEPQRENLEHTGRLVLVDAKGLQRVGYPIDQATPERVAHDLRLLESGA